MSILLRIVLVLAAWWAVRALLRARRLRASGDRERRRAAQAGRYSNLSDQEVSDADFEEIP